jgi:uncharacterized metal-binding protein
MMASNGQKDRIFVIPCSGIGKVFGLLSREVVYRVADTLLPDRADAACLALLVSGDVETQRKVQRTACITVDGCPKLCAMKNVELAGGKVAQSIRVYDATKRHRGANFGTATNLTDEGWAVVDEIADEIAMNVRQKTVV